MTDKSSKAIGTEYEEKAARFLEQQGFRILERNYRNKRGEIDLIARESGYLCFIEVKFRNAQQSVRALEAVDKNKQRRISRAALYYLMEKGLGTDIPCRFDVAGITPDGIEVIKNAFEFQP